MTRILGYDTTTTIEALTAFIAQAEIQYDGLERAIAPVDEKITDLQKDWDLRSTAFWQPLLRTFIPVIRKATTGCLELFDRKRSCEVPIPLVPSASVTLTSDLYSVEKSIEEAGIRIISVFRGEKKMEFPTTTRHARVL